MGEKNIVVGDELERTIFESLGTLARVVLEMYADSVLQIDAETKEEITGRIILNRSMRLARFFREMGLVPGDSVSISSENRIEYGAVPVATFFVGATFAPFNPEYTAVELNHVVNLSKPKIIFCSEKTIRIMLQVLPNFPYVKKIVLFGDQRFNHPMVVMYKDVVKGLDDNAPIDETFVVTEINPDETVATILCSSGTTGMPKGVMTTHANMTYFLEVGRAVVSELLDNSTKRVTLGLAPFYHSMGYMLMTLNMLAGNQIIVIRRFNAKTFLGILEEYKVTHLIVPPPVILFIIKNNTGKHDLSSVTEIRSGAAPMSKDMEMEVKEKLKLQHASQGYGMTETTLGVLMTKSGDSKVGSVGKIVPGMMAKVIDKNGNRLGAYQEGELCFKGPLIMKGYIDDEVATKNAIDKDNWLHTGDVAYYDSEGFFFIVDRIKELIKYKAYQVAPAELEGLLLTHPSIADAAVIGLPDEEAGELPLAFVVKRNGSNITAKQIQDFIAGNLLDIVAQATKISRGSIARIVREGRAIETGEKTAFLTAPIPKCSPKSSTDNFAEEAIRRVIFNFHITDNQKPTIKMVYNKIKDDEGIGFTGKVSSFRTLLHKIGFRWRKTTDNRKILMERNDIRELRCCYIRAVTSYRAEGRPIIYTEKVSSQKKLRGGVYFIDAIPKNPSGKILRRVLKDKVKRMISKL